MSLVFSFLLFLGIVVFVTLRTVKKQLNLMQSYRLIIGESTITREQLSLMPVTITQHDIKEIIKTRKGSIIIKLRQANSTLVIPYFIENYVGAEALVSNFGTVTKGKEAVVVQKLKMALPFLAIVLMVIVYAAEIKWLVGISGVLLLVLMVWSFIGIRGNKDLNPKIRASAWWLLLVALTVIFTVFLKLSGLADTL